MKTSQIPEVADGEVIESAIVTVETEGTAKKLRRADPSLFVGPQGDTGPAGADGGDGSAKYLARIQMFGDTSVDVKVIYNTIGTVTWERIGVGVVEATLPDGAPGDGRTINFVGQESVTGDEKYCLTRTGAVGLQLTHWVLNPATSIYELSDYFNEVSVSIQIFPEA